MTMLNEKLWHVAMEAAPNAMVMVDAEGVIVLVNAQSEKLFGYAREELLGERVEMLVPERFRKDHPGKREGFFSAPAARSMGVGRELFGLRRDGSEVSIEIGLNPIKTSEGTYALAAIIDITERRRSEMATRSLAAIVESSDDAIISKDLNGIIQSWNKGAESIFGYTAAEMVGQPMTLLFPPELFHEEEAILARIRRGEVVDHFEAVRVRKDGRRINVSVTISPITNSAGQIVAASKIARDITNQKRVAAELEISRRELRDMADNANVGLHWVNREGIIIWANQAELNLLGYSAEEYIGQPIARFHADPEVISDILARLTRLETLVGYEARLVAKDGSIRYVSIHSSVYNPEGQFKHTRCFTTDITARKRLEEDRDRFFANSLDLLCIANAEGYFRKVNPAFKRVLGYSEAELLARPFMDFIHPDDRAPTLAEVKKVSGGTSTIGFENRYRCSDGSYRILQWNAVKDPISGLIHATARDVTEHREQLQLLALGKDVGLALTQGGASRVMLQDCAEAIVRHLHAAFARIWTVSESGDILELQASAGMYTHLDGPHGKVPVGKFKIGLIAQERKPHLTNQVVGDSRVGDQEWARREGMIAFAGHPLLVADRLLGVVALFARHQLSSTALSALNSIAHIVAVGIDRKKAEGALAKSEQEAKSATRAKSEFLANMSHEIRTPMNGVLGMTRLALNTELTPRQREYLEMAHRSAESLLDIVNDILDFSKIEAGKLTLDAAPFSVQETVENLVKDMAIRAHAKNLELTCQLDAEIPATLLGDAGRLRQVLLNLLSNAIKFTDKGEVDLAVRRAAGTNQEVELQFSVRDTGMGIPRDRLTRIFEAFEQADTSITRTHGGTGLGLSISARLVSMMGGCLKVESEVGVGSAFHFQTRFPLSELPAMRSHGPSLPELRGIRALIVDDNSTNRRILHDVLLHWRMEPHCVNGGVQALEAMERAVSQGAPFSLVLLDAMMPEMDGFAVAGQLRSNRTYDAATIMMLSSADDQQDIARCRSIGIQSYLTKPVILSHLLDAIVEALGNSAARTNAVNFPHLTAPAAGTKQGVRVLVAEDNLINQKVVAGLLESAGYQITIVSNGKQVVEALEQETYDVILMDLQMPEMDGFQATAAIREREKKSSRQTPVIALTAHALKQDEERCLAAGMNGYVTKPLQPDVLFRAIDNCVSSSPAVKVETPAVRRETDGDLTLDREALLARVGGNTKLLAEILQVCPGEFSRLMADLEIAVTRRDLQRVQLVAHTLKGSLGNLGAGDGYEASWRLEDLARKGDLDGALEVFQHVREQVERVRLAVVQFEGELTA